MKKEKLNKFILYFLLFQPILDVFTSIQIRNDIGLFSIGTLIRGLFFLFIIIYLYKNNIGKKYIFMFIIYVFLAMSYYVIDTKNDIITEVINLIKIFYLPFLIYFFNNYENEKINDKFILGLYLIYLNLIIIPYMFGIGNYISEIYINKNGYFGLFNSGNEISAIILCLMPIVMNYIFNSKNYLLKIFVFIEVLVAVIFIGTKLYL